MQFRKLPPHYPCTSKKKETRNPKVQIGPQARGAGANAARGYWETRMKRSLCRFVCATFLSMPLMAQQPGVSISVAVPNQGNETRAAAVEPMRPFSRLALGGGIGIMGINLQAAANLNRYSNLRVSGNVFSYSVNDITSNGFTANGKLDLASMGISLDYFPWPNHGFRLSPGLLIYNENGLTAKGVVSGGQSFTLNDVNYYSSSSDPVHANAKVGLNATKPAFTITTGWGNMISRKGGHWSFPLELGAAFVGSPSFNMTLAGTACDVSGEVCVDTATNAEIQSNLQAQIAKYKKDVEPLKVFPIVSAGVAYSFGGR